MKALRVTISGSYRTADKDIIDYNVSGVIPFIGNEDILIMHIRRRYAAMWIAASNKYKDRVLSIRECYIDKIELIEAEFSFVGKDIIEMTQEELQDLASVKDLRSIPLYKKTSTRQMQNVAYASYAKSVLGQQIDEKEEAFNIAKLPPIIVKDPSWQQDKTKKHTNEEILASEQESQQIQNKKK
jgi:hypothetical protein